MSWNGAQGQIDAPAPYHLDVVTSRKLDNWHSHLRLENPGIYASIRYDNNIDDVSQAWVGMHLSDFVVLLKAHYETIEDRIKGE